VLTTGGNTFVGGGPGEWAGKSANGVTESTFVGDKAGMSIVGGASGNSQFATCVGHNACGSETTAANFVAIGTDAMRDTVGTTSTVAIGVAADRDWVTSFSVAIGPQALAGNTGGGSTGGANTAVGYQAMLGAAATTAQNNVSIGANSMNSGSLTSASQNTVVGTSSGQGLTTGTQNVFLGTQQGNNITTGAGNVSIGYNSGPTGNVNDTVVIGSNGNGGANGARGGTQSVVVGARAGNASLTGRSILIGFSIGQTNCGTGNDVIEIFTNAGDCSASNAANEIQIGTGSSPMWKATGTNSPSTAASIFSGVPQFPNVATGTPAASLCLDGSNNVVKKTTTGSCV
jgi:hypothetical protein